MVEACHYNLPLVSSSMKRDQVEVINWLDPYNCGLLIVGDR